MGGVASQTLEGALQQALSDPRCRFSRLDGLMWQHYLVPYVRGSFLSHNLYRLALLPSLGSQASYILGNETILLSGDQAGFISGVEKSPVMKYLTGQDYYFYDEHVVRYWQKGTEEKEGQYLVNWRQGVRKIVPGHYQYQNGYFRLDGQAYDLALQPLPVINLFTLPRGRVYHNQYPDILPKPLRKKIIPPSYAWFMLGKWNNKLMVTPEGNIFLVDTRSDFLLPSIFRLYSPTGQLIFAWEWQYEIMFISPQGRWYFRDQSGIWVDRI